jgi:excisionase family DNA binding protein
MFPQSQLKSPVGPGRPLVRKAEVLRELGSDPLLSLSQVKEILGLSYSSLNKLLSNGTIKFWRAIPRGFRRVRVSELQRFLASGDAAHE